MLVFGVFEREGRRWIGKGDVGYGLEGERVEPRHNQVARKLGSDWSGGTGGAISELSSLFHHQPTKSFSAVHHTKKSGQETAAAASST